MVILRSIIQSNFKEFQLGSIVVHKTKLQSVKVIREIYKTYGVDVEMIVHEKNVIAVCSDGSEINLEDWRTL